MIFKTWEQPRGPSIDEWVNRLCCIHTMECYLVIKRNELSKLQKTGRNCKYLVSERSESEKATHYMTPTV